MVWPLAPASQGKPGTRLNTGEVDTSSCMAAVTWSSMEMGGVTAARSKGYESCLDLSCPLFPRRARAGV